MIYQHHEATVKIQFHCEPNDTKLLQSLLIEAIDCITSENVDLKITKVDVEKVEEKASNPDCYICDDRFIDHLYGDGEEEMFV